MNSAAATAARERKREELSRLNQMRSKMREANDLTNMNKYNIGRILFLWVMIFHPFLYFQALLALVLVHLTRTILAIAIPLRDHLTILLYPIPTNFFLFLSIIWHIHRHYQLLKQRVYWGERTTNRERERAEGGQREGGKYCNRREVTMG